MAKYLPSLGFEPGFFSLQSPGSGTITTLHCLTLQGPVLRLLCGHQPSLFVLGAGRGKRGRKGPQPVLPGPNWGIKRYSVPPPSSSAEFSSASSALYLLLTTIDQMNQGLRLLHFCIPICVCRCSMW